jgi:hypothetical protein
MLEEQVESKPGSGGYTLQARLRHDWISNRVSRDGKLDRHRNRHWYHHRNRGDAPQLCAVVGTCVTGLRTTWMRAAWQPRRHGHAREGGGQKDNG